MYKATANLLIVCFLCWMTGCSSTNTVSEDLVPTDYVNPFIGASTSVGAAGVYHGLGKTFPGATTPYGMVQVSPNTITGGDNGSGYSDEHKTIEGFAFTQMSGVGWFGDLGNFLVMPTTGELYKVAGKENNDSIKGYRSVYNKATETAKAGYYSVELTDYHIKVESSATPHCGILHFTYPSSDQSRIQIDLARRVGGTSTSQYIKVVDDYTIQGWMKCTPDGGGWGNGEGKADYTVYYYAQFSKPLTNYGFWSADIPEHWVRKRDEVVSIPYLTRVSQAPVIKDKKELTGKHLGFFTEFPTKEGETVEMKVGISFVDMEGAANNFEQEIASKNFGQVKQEATELWNKELNRVRISGGTDDEKTIFYTAMYHAFLSPNLFTDVDGRYLGMDLKVHTTDKEDPVYTTFSIWDTFRALHPLLTIIDPHTNESYIRSLLKKQREGGVFPKWDCAANYTGTMIGYHAASIITDAYVKGYRDFDVREAYQACLRTAEYDTTGIVGPKWLVPFVMPRARYYKDALGYIPCDLENESVAKALEYAYDDWCISVLADSLGDVETRDKYARFAGAYKSYFDPETRFMRGRDSKGKWRTPFNPRSSTHRSDDYCEGTAWQWTWFVPHDVPGLVGLMGGEEAFAGKLDSLFTVSSELEGETVSADISGLIGQYAHGNEPSHHIIHLYNYVNRPWRTQELVDSVLHSQYRNAPDGLSGNEDCGQMSAWYILNAMGFYQVCPGEPVYSIGRPLFEEVTIHLPGQKDFVIRTKNNSKENKYVQSILLNGKPLEQPFFTHSDLTAGGVMEISMGAEPFKP